MLASTTIGMIGFLQHLVHEQNGLCDKDYGNKDGVGMSQQQNLFKTT